MRIRYALPEEADKVTSLLKTAVGDLETGHLEALAEGQCGMWLLEGLSGARLVEPLVRAAAADDMKSAAAAMSLPLVAQDRDGHLVGALLAVPSGAVISTITQLPGHEQHALLSILKYAKIKAVAVSEDAHGRGIGAALLKRCVQVYWRLDYMLLFGGFEAARDLGPYYTRQGFTVLPMARPRQVTGLAQREGGRRPERRRILGERRAPAREAGEPHR